MVCMYTFGRNSLLQYICIMCAFFKLFNYSIKSNLFSGQQINHVLASCRSVSIHPIPRPSLTTQSSTCALDASNCSNGTTETLPCVVCWRTTNTSSVINVDLKQWFLHVFEVLSHQRTPESTLLLEGNNLTTPRTIPQ